MNSVLRQLLKSIFSDPHFCEECPESLPAALNSVARVKVISSAMSQILQLHSNNFVMVTAAPHARATEKPLLMELEALDPALKYRAVNH